MVTLLVIQPTPTTLPTLEIWMEMRILELLKLLQLEVSFFPVNWFVYQSLMERGEGFVNWLEAIENTQQFYNWAPNTLVQVAKTKGGPKIAEWDRGNHLRGNSRNIWDGPGNFRESLMLRFGPKYASATAVNAVSDLKQRSKELCADFLDRVVLAINKQNFNIAEADKRTPQYLQVFDASIMSHFGAGLKDEIGKVVLGAATPPGMVEEMLQAAKAVEVVQEEAPTAQEGDQMLDLA